MKKLITISMSFLMWCFMAGMIGNDAPKTGMSSGVAVSLFLIVTVLMAYAPRRKLPGVHTADVAVEQWVPYIIERLWKNNQFLDYAWSDDQYVIGGKIVHIPQPGAVTTVTKNNTSYPVATVQRADNDITYLLDNYTTPPTHIPDVDMSIISYDKVMSIIDDLYGYLIQAVADDTIYKWLNTLPAASVIRTTGPATASLETGQTGNRLACIADNLKTARTRLNKQNISKDGRVAIFESNMLNQLTDSLTITQYRDFTREYDPKTGAIGQLFGFNIIDRSTAGMVQDAMGGGVVANDFETATGTTDQVACLCYHPNAVARALGDRKMFQRVEDPQYYGSIYSTLVRMGGRRRRGDDTGIVAIVQAAA